MADLARLCVLRKNSIREVMACIDGNAKGVALVVDPEGRLISTVTDGDLRRAVLKGADLDWPVSKLLEQRPPEPHPTPLTARVGTGDAQLLRMMNEYGVRHIPLLDEAGRLVDVALLSELAKEYEMPLTAVVMSGGFGTRLRPLTEELPKPMLRVGGRPLLELLIRQLRDAGMRRVHVTTHYKADVISQHFGDGRDFGVEIQYVREDQPLGTAGSLGLLESSNVPLLVINGDILTRVDFHAMLGFHEEHQADMTVGVRQQEFRVPYGIIESDGLVVRRIVEKPIVRYFISAGVYLLKPSVCKYVPPGQPYEMPDLISRLVAEGLRVVSFPIHEYWLDIGQPEDYQRAINDIQNGEL